MKADPMDEKVLFKLVNDVSIKYFQTPFADEVVFNHRLRTTGGRYIPSERRIELKDRKSTRLNSSHVAISYAVFCLKKKTKRRRTNSRDRRRASVREDELQP